MKLNQTLCLRHSSYMYVKLVCCYHFMLFANHPLTAYNFFICYNLHDNELKNRKKSLNAVNICCLLLVGKLAHLQHKTVSVQGK